MTIHSDLKTRISITRSFDGTDTPRIHVRLIHETSGATLSDTYLTQEDFGSALFDSSEKPCTTDFYATDPKVIGAAYETKCELLPDPSIPGEARDDEVSESAHAFEVDGWKVVEYDRLIFKATDGARYRVTYGRYVDSETGLPIHLDDDE